MATKTVPVIAHKLTPPKNKLRKMPTLHSHTYCQVAPAQARTKTWQRLYLTNRTTKITKKPMDEKEQLNNYF